MPSNLVPQNVYWNINANIFCLINLGETLPPHLSPFVGERRVGDYVPPEEKQLDSTADASMLTHEQEEEEEDSDNSEEEQDDEEEEEAKEDEVKVGRMEKMDKEELKKMQETEEYR